jgi:hypothetical protein
MTRVATLTPQHWHVLDYLMTAWKAALQGDSLSPLPPSPGDRERLMRSAA